MAGATQLQLRRDARSDVNNFTGAEGEPIYITDENRLNMHDGITQGGIDQQIFSDQFNNTYNFGTASGTNTLTVTLQENPGSYTTGQSFWFKAGSSNTGSTTINFNSNGAKTINKVFDGSLVVLDEDDIVQNGMYQISYNGTVFVMQSPTSGAPAGVWEVLSTLTLSSSANITFDSNITSTFKYYRVIGLTINPSSSMRLDLQTSSNGGSSYASGGSDYLFYCIERKATISGVDQDFDGDNGSTSMQMVGNSISQLSSIGGEGFNFVMTFHNPAETVLEKTFKWMVMGDPLGGVSAVWDGYGARRDSALVNAIRIDPSSGNFTSGFVSLEGWNVL